MARPLDAARAPRPGDTSSTNDSPFTERASPHSGTSAPKDPSDAPALSLYLIGESTVAGVGARTHELALSGQLALRLAEALARPVHWGALGLISARARDCLELLVELELIPRLERAPADLIVFALGVNDTTKLTARAQWREALDQIVQRVREKTSCPILFTSLPPMEHFRALPQPLRVMLGARARMLDGDIARIAHRSPGVHHHHAELEFEPDYLASDGFHPSELGYARWGAQLAVQAARLVAAEEQAYSSRRDDRKDARPLPGSRENRRRWYG